jgi:TRAP-type C4-dicarboxylate transport system permease small subunit
MPWGPLGVTAVLTALDWGAWEWATSANHPTIGLIAGLLMAPIAVGFAWSFVRVVVALAQLGLRRASSQARLQSVPRGGHRPAPPFDIEAKDERVAA